VELAHVAKVISTDEPAQRDSSANKKESGMAMSTASLRESDPMMEMNTTPLIDVLLVLLILFILTLPAITHKTGLTLPAGPVDPVKNAPAPIDLRIDFDGTLVWNGTIVSNLTELEEYLLVEAMQPVQSELHVRPDRRAQYDTIAKVLAIAQRSGIQRIGFTGQEQFDL
jgi:biopolymer transport protein ExbD